MTWLHRLWLRWMDRHDPAAVMQTPVVKFHGYDYAKARTAFMKAQTHTETGRSIPRPKRARRDNVTPMRRRA